ncbi:MAG: M56 family metallopeptidase [Eubacterium sp.]|nr:M56 family metallopeptidase [Eubacterium sp.]
MNEFLKQLFSLSLSGSLLFLLLLLLKKLYKNRLSKCWQYYIFLAAALRFLLPFAPDAALAAALLHTPQLRAVQLMPSQKNGQLSVSDGFQHFGQQTASAGTQPSGHQQDRSAGTQPLESTEMQREHFLFFLYFLWLVPALLLLAKKITAYRGFLRYIKTAGTAVDEISLLDLLASCAKACKVKRPVELYYSPLLTSPVMTGFFRPCIAIPKKELPEKELPEKELSEKELSLIFTHELYHYRRRDMFYKWLIQAVVCIHWFNPLVYLLEKEVNLACELSCDEAVIRSMSSTERKAYGDMLLYCSRAALFQKTSVSSLTLAEGAQQLKERLGAIMRFQQPTKKMKLATISLTAAICFGSAAIGAYTVPARPAHALRVPSNGQAQNQESNTQAKPPGYAAANTVNSSKYQALLALRTSSYQNQSVRQFRSKAAFELDTPEGNALLEQAFKDEALRFHRLDNEDAFFLCNTLMLATGSWKKVPLEAVGVERLLENGGLAELDFKAEIKLNNPDIKVSEYEAAFRGLADTATAFLNSKTDAELSSLSVKSADSLSKEATKALKKYAKSVNQKGNLTLVIYMCHYSLEDTAMHSPWVGADSDAATGSTYDALPEEVKKVLSLKVTGYKDYTLQQFFDYIGEQYEADHSLWKARQQLWKVLDEEAEQNLSKEDAQFLDTTLPCTESESTYERDRVGTISPDFSARYELPYAKHGTTIGFEWAVRYKIKDPELTVGQRDQIILNVKNKMEEFVKSTWETDDIATMGYLKKVRSRLDQLVKENSSSGLEMTVFQCMSDGKSA